MSARQMTIDGRTFSLGMMSAETSFLVSLRILKQIGEPAFRLVVEFASREGDVSTMEGLKAVFSEVQKDASAVMQMGAAIIPVLKQIDPPEFLAIAKSVFGAMTAEREPGKATSHASLADTGMFDLVFKGHPKLLWKVLIPALGENYRDFFDNAGTPSSLPAT